ncbi:hypothetical protein KR044_006861 [Drosophila immigrans]|nr:hypothetical protein KR044_006861 [Drosophila immigrans]
MDVGRLVMLCEQNELNLLKLLEWEEEYDETVDGCRLSHQQRQRKKRKAPREWAFPRSSEFWEQIVPHTTDADFKQHFRVSKNDFNKLLDFLKGMKKADTSYRKAIALDKRIAIALYTLGTTVDYEAVGELFGVSAPMVSKILKQFCSEVKRVLAADYMSDDFLTQHTVEECVQGFAAQGFPQCIGAVGDCMNSLLVLVDYRGRFLHVELKTRQPDAENYEASALREIIEASPLLEFNSKLIEGVQVPLLLVADSNFELSTTIMTPYAECQTVEQSVLNSALDEARQIVDRAWRDLRARFGRVPKAVENPGKVNDIVSCCSILHNFLICHNSGILESWLSALPPQEAHANLTLETPWDPNAELIRQAISTKLTM